MLEGASKFIAIGVCVASLFAACGGSSSSVNDCPSYVVVPDAGVSGFSSVGEWQAGAVCAQYCADSYSVCQLASPTSIKCQAAGG
jgi:hypothetical protein